ncbi:MAG: hypothetical protein RIT81_13985 [Deltaproteobacteria bacterium]
MRKACLLSLALVLAAETAEAQNHLADGLFFLPLQQPEGSLQPNLDGVVNAYEYYDGKYFDFASFAGATDGRGFIVASGSHPQADWDASCAIHDGAPGSCKRASIHLGLEVPIVTPAPAHGYVTFYIDFDRSIADSQLDDVTRPEDRQIRFEYGGADAESSALGAVVMTELRGTNGSWVDITGTADAVVGAHAVTNAGDGSLHVELRVEDLPFEALGLAITHVGAAGGAFHAFPDDDVSSVLPSTWEKVELRAPQSIVLHSLATFNVGQHVDVSLCQIIGAVPACTFWPIANAGSGHAGIFAKQVREHDTVCLQEAWSRGTREEILQALREQTDQNNEDPYHVVGAPPDDNPDGDYGGWYYVGGASGEACVPVWTGVDWDCLDLGINEYTGLLLLSRTPVIDSQIFEFGEASSGQCHGDFGSYFLGSYDSDVDCSQDKGMIWARVPTNWGKTIDFPEHEEDLWDATEFTDVFCTQLDAGNEPGDRAAVIADLAQIKAWIDSVRAKDRPAFLLGDMNVDWQPGPAPNPPSAAGSADYQSMLTILGIDQLSTFDALNSQYSDRYDLFVNDGGSRAGTLPHHPDVFVEGCTDTVVDNLDASPVVDYILVLPAQSSLDQFPSWAIAKQPTTSVAVPGGEDEDCASDHAVVSASVGLLPLYAPGKWNPSKTHKVVHRATNIYDYDEGYESDSEWSTPNHRILLGGAPESWSDECVATHSSEDTCNGTCNLNWSSCEISVSGTEFAGAYVDVDDEENGYWEWDTAPGGSRSPRFIFDHFAGSWVRTDQSWAAAAAATMLDDLNPPPDDPTWTIVLDVEGDGFIGSEDVDHRARVTHILEAREQ